MRLRMVMRRRMVMRLTARNHFANEVSLDSDAAGRSHIAQWTRLVVLFELSLLLARLFPRALPLLQFRS